MSTCIRNRYRARCADCNEMVDVGAGYVRRIDKGQWRVVHSMDRSCVRVTAPVPQTHEDHRARRYARFMAEAGGDVDAAVRLMYVEAEFFDGEAVIALGAELAFRAAVGAPTDETRRRLAEARAYEESLSW